MRSQWKLGLLIGVELVILCAIPGQRLTAAVAGETVTLAVSPADPYDLLSGYYVDLRYDIERDPAGVDREIHEGQTVYVTIERAQPAWKAVDLTLKPIAPTADRRSVQMLWTGHSPHLAAGRRFYIPESDREEISSLLSARRWPATMEMRVLANGTAEPMRLTIAGKSWSAWK